MAEASSDTARRSSGSRLCTLRLPHDFAMTVISIVMEVRKLCTRCGAQLGIEPRLELGVLRRDADGAAAGVAVVAGARRRAEGGVVGPDRLAPPTGV